MIWVVAFFISSGNKIDSEHDGATTIFNNWFDFLLCKSLILIPLHVYFLPFCLNTLILVSSYLIILPKAIWPMWTVAPFSPASLETKIKGTLLILKKEWSNIKAECQKIINVYKNNMVHLQICQLRFMSIWWSFMCKFESVSTTKAEFGSDWKKSWNQTCAQTLILK